MAATGEEEEEESTKKKEEEKKKSQCFDAGVESVKSDNLRLCVVEPKAGSGSYSDTRRCRTEAWKKSVPQTCTRCQLNGPYRP